MLKKDLLPYIRHEEITEMTLQLAKEIEQDYQGQEIIWVCPLKGAVYFLSDLIRNIRLSQRIDFVRLTSDSHESEQRGNTIKIQKDVSENISGQHVLIVQEIMDGCRTLSFLKNRLLQAHPASLKIVTLLDKPARRIMKLKADYVGRTIEDRFVVGYGMDDLEIGRNYSDIYYLKH